MYNIVGAMFADEQEARQAMAALAETPKFNGTTIFQMSLVKRRDGELKLCDNFVSEHLDSRDTLRGGLVGGLVGLLAGPLALLGNASDADNEDDSKALIEQVAQRLEEGDLALIIMADETEEAVLDRALVKYNVVIVRYDAETIANEVEEAEKRETEA